MDTLNIAVRAYVRRDIVSAPAMEPKQPPKKYAKKKTDAPSPWVLIFDTETTTNAAQKLRFGTYQIRKGDVLMESGIFYDTQTLSKKEQALLVEYATTHKLKLLTVTEFVDDVFYRVGYRYRGSIVGLNLPFDISRLATHHAPARVTQRNKRMQGGFTFKLSENPHYPRVQIKHLSARTSFIQFAATKGQRTTKESRKKGRWEPVRRGYFLDIKTLSWALMSTSHSLASLAKALEVNAQKHDTDEHGKTLTPKYIEYALQDTQVTWECFYKLKSLYALHRLHQTGAHRIHSEASLGKAYLREMGIKPWVKLQPDFPPEMIGQIMSTYYGGRSEVHIRREITQVLYCDFLSMYPTVCTLMGLWRFVTAQGMTQHDSTAETREFLENVTLSQLQQQDTWQSLCTIVQIMPDADILPVRAKYTGDNQYTIGTNHLTSKRPLWFTLADCISAKLLNGRAPHILQAVSFVPMEMQNDMKPVNIAGNDAYRVDPRTGDFFKQIIDLRTTIKKQKKSAPVQDHAALESQQLALKILANSTSYGIFLEFNVEEERLSQAMACYSASGKPIPIRQKKFEEAGLFFHPMLATCITGAAKLMLAITERQACDAGLDWAFCDTDSMALAKPDSMPEAEFLEKARHVQEWFTPLNPYAEKAPLLKIEDYNYTLSEPKALQPLYCYAVSSKRYALFNIGADGAPILRKVSAHGLGHLKAPYETPQDSMLEDAQQWQQDLWVEIIKAALSGDDTRPNLAGLRNFNTPAFSRYGATTPALEKWFAAYNKNKPYCDRVRPFNFLLTMRALPHLKELKPVASYDKDHAKALQRCFDRTTGEKIYKRQLRTYLDGLAQYHLHSESKFMNGSYRNKGNTKRRHIVVKAVQYIGKEANKLEEQYYIGADPDAQLEYTMNPDDKAHMLEMVLKAMTLHGAKAVALASKLSPRNALKIHRGQSQPSDKTLAKLYAAAQRFEMDRVNRCAVIETIKATMAAQNISFRTLAEKLDVDASNLAKILAGRRVNNVQLARVQAYLQAAAP